MSQIRVINEETLHMDLDTSAGRYLGFTQYNTSCSTLVISQPTLDELIQLEEAIAISKTNLKQKELKASLKQMEAKKW